MVQLLILDAAEVVLFQCINKIKNEKGEVTAIEMNFEFLDDFQDPIQGGLYGVVNTLFGKTSTNNETSDLQAGSVEFHRTEPPPLVKFNSHNHILQWMVRT